jgi:hypothetical protein
MDRRTRSAHASLIHAMGAKRRKKRKMVEKMRSRSLPFAQPPGFSHASPFALFAFFCGQIFFAPCGKVFGVAARND